MYICSEINRYKYNLISIMINKSLTYIKGYLSDNLKENGWTVELGALSKEGQSAGRDILITLVQIEEERNAKSQEYYHFQKDASGKTKKVKTQPLELKFNLYILISSQNEQYETALKQISQVIGIFQVKNAFKEEEINKAGIESLILDLHPLTFEQNNSLWQTLGTTVTPSVMYKLRTIVIQEGAEKDEDLYELKIQVENEEEEKIKAKNRHKVQSIK